MELPAFQKRMWWLFTCIVGYSRKNPKNEDIGISKGIEEHMEIPGIK